ncbi:hypothetical protein C5E45_08830 [Nocardia nova]|uniref:Uncharacterized protein n=1 Tax=Nocardia nova TaxID=37330 RepID=A0A2S6AT48_9NOCA|nr:hypothetical protein [Nocardia nova]PPJ26050.1 hypothetical protein C5E41_18070 [Nocardia nova]PPJ38384.1 hypothetical protein C5E45_08830 [Nocardia nova]
MTAPPLLPSTIDRPREAAQHAVSVIRRVRDAVSALPAPTLPRDTVVASTVGDLASVHVIDRRTIAVIARKDRHIQPITAMITYLPGLAVAVIGSAIIVTVV